MESPISQPTPLDSLIAYQPDSVVSRVLLHTEGAVMTLFAFSAGEGLTEHQTPHEATVLILEGDVRISIGDEEHHVEAGEILHLPSSVPHSLRGERPFKMLLTLLKRPTGS